MNAVFLQVLEDNGWLETKPDWEYRKGTCIIRRDTGDWWMIFSEQEQRVFDFPEPLDHTARWTVNLIEKLCSLEENNFIEK